MSQYCSLEEAYKTAVPKKVQKPEGFQSMKPLDKPYSAQYTDYDFMCKNSGICLTKPKETFKGSCAPLSAPTYKYPFSEKDKEKFRKALKVALEQMENPEPPPPPPPPEPVSITDAEFNGFIDKELEAYMMVNDMKDNVNQTVLPPAGPPPSDFTPIVAGVPLDTTTTALKDEPKNFTKGNTKLFDLLLFIIAGILIILIMDQIFRLAMLVGMNKTLKMMDRIIEMQK
jgi:hypothetical protein